MKDIQPRIASESLAKLPQAIFRTLGTNQKTLPIPSLQGCERIDLAPLGAFGLSLRFLVHLDLKALFPSSPQVWAGADGHQAIDLRAQVNICTGLRSGGAVHHEPRSRVDIDGLEQVKRAGDVVRWNIPWLQCLGQVFPAAMIRELLWSDVSEIVLGEPPFSGCELETGAAAHTMLQIVGTFLIGIFYDGEQMAIGLGHEHIPGANENLPVVNLGSGLVEPVSEVIPVEGHKIGDGSADHSDHLPLL